jgi:hypothetical protein
MLYELPDNFQSNNKANGWSFLEACVDKNGTQWTGEPHFVELLMILGLAIGRVEYCLPKKMWSALPKGLPYFRVLHENEIEDKEGEST